MKIFFRLLFLYILFLIQTSITKLPLDFAVLGLIIFALNDPPIYVLGASVWLGFLFGLLNPTSFGFQIIILTIIAFVVNSIRRYIYRDKIYIISIIFFALLFKYLMSVIFIQTRIRFFTWFLSAMIILILAIPLESLINRIFYRQWKMKVYEEKY